MTFRASKDSGYERCRRLAENKCHVAAFVLLLLTLGLWTLNPQTLWGAALPPNFQESTVFSGLSEPTAVEFASDGRIFVAEKSGLIKVFDDIGDTTPSVFADLRTNVFNFWDRGLLGLALDPNFPATPHVYVLYTHDAAIGGTAPRWGTVGGSSDVCPTPPGPTGDGCVVSGRLSRLVASGGVMSGSEQVLIEDWCQQYPSHSIGDLAFGADGALYVSGGEGASYTFTDYGQDGNPLNPCGDPPAGVGGVQSTPTAEGGALRSQDLRTSGDPAGLNGAILRVDPNTGAGLLGNPLFGSADPNARRIIAYGARNPFRFTIRPGTNEAWVGDVGYDRFEEINRIADPGGPIENFGWPCYEGGKDASGNPVSLRQPAYDAAHLNICKNLYKESNAVTAPYFAYDSRSEHLVAGETCPIGTASISGLAFVPQTGGDYPVAYGGALFFADFSRDCIWAMRAGANGLPDPATRQTFVDGAANPVELEIGPAGDLFYVDLYGGTIRRIKHLGTGNQPPIALADASPRSGPVPLTVDFDGTGSSDPDPGDTITYAWDLDNDGAYDDSHDSQPSFTYQQPGSYTVRLRVTDGPGATDTDTVTINASETPPTATIDTPTAGTTWRVDDVIGFSGGATDQQDGPLGPSALSWSLLLNHCPGGCHTHTIQSFNGVSSGSFVAPDHEYPSHLELRLTATDSAGLQDTKIVNLDPRTVALTFASSPAGLQLAVGSSSATAPFSREVIVGSNNSVSAPVQTLDGTSYAFWSWGDGGAQSHQIVAPETATTYTAAFVPIQELTFAPEADARVEEDQPTANFGASYLAAKGGSEPDVESYLRFQVAGVSGPVHSAKLRLWVTNPSSDGPAVYSTENAWSETGITWSNRPAPTSGATDDKGALGSGAWVEYDVEPLLSGDGAYSFVLATTSTDGIDFPSREDGSVTLRPQLVVSFLGGADISLAASDSPDPIVVGQELTYALNVNNAGPWTTGATLTDTLPKSVMLRSARSDHGRCSSRRAKSVKCILGELASGESATVTIVVRPTRIGTIFNRASLHSPLADPNQVNNSAVAETAVSR